MNLVTKSKVVFTIVLAVPPFLSLCQADSNHLRIEKLRPLMLMVGDWALNSAMIPLGRPKIIETGSMSCRSMFDSTYVECDVSLNQREW